jgi:hypothetical protein
MTSVFGSGADRYDGIGAVAVAHGRQAGEFDRAP